MTKPYQTRGLNFFHVIVSFERQKTTPNLQPHRFRFSFWNIGEQIPIFTKWEEDFIFATHQFFKRGVTTIAQNLGNIIGELIDSAGACQITPSMSSMARNLGDTIKYGDRDWELFKYVVKKVCFDAIYLQFRNIAYTKLKRLNYIIIISGNVQTACY